MVRAARGIRRGWHRLSTLSYERGEEFRPIDVGSILTALHAQQRQNLAVLVDCHQRTRTVRVQA